MSSNFVSPTGYIELDNDCEYSIDRKSTRSREEVDPKKDLSFYWNTYLVPKYGLGNINVNNVASFMKELEMNWTKLTPDLQNKVLDIMIDSVFATNNSFRSSLLAKLNSTPQPLPTPAPQVIPSITKPDLGEEQSVSTFGKKSTFGSSSSNNTLLYIILAVVLLIFCFFIFNKTSIPAHPKFR